jgi:hypothetical protein
MVLFAVKTIDFPHYGIRCMAPYVTCAVLPLVEDLQEFARVAIASPLEGTDFRQATDLVVVSLLTVRPWLPQRWTI